MSAKGQPLHSLFYFTCRSLVCVPRPRPWLDILCCTSSYGSRGTNEQSLAVLATCTIWQNRICVPRTRLSCSTCSLIIVRINPRQLFGFCENMLWPVRSPHLQTEPPKTSRHFSGRIRGIKRQNKNMGWRVYSPPSQKTAIVLGSVYFTITESFCPSLT